MSWLNPWLKAKKLERDNRRLRDEYVAFAMRMQAELHDLQDSRHKMICALIKAQTPPQE